MLNLYSLFTIIIIILIITLIKMTTVMKNLSKTTAQLDIVTMDFAGCLLHVARLTHLDD